VREDIGTERLGI
jgi:hypothetical protein